MLKLVVVIGLLALGWWLLFRQRRPAPAQGLSVEEARALLGVAADADADAIRLAHRRLIAQVHPDAGGTAELARRVNLARDVALAAVPAAAPGR
jgi:hypothetical protein